MYMVDIINEIHITSNISSIKTNGINIINKVRFIPAIYARIIQMDIDIINSIVFAITVAKTSISLGKIAFRVSCFMESRTFIADIEVLEK